MKITQINGYTVAGSTLVDLTLDTNLPVAEAIASVLALFACDRGINGTGAVVMKNVIDELPADMIVAPKPSPTTDEPAAKATRTRRPRTNPDAAPVVTGEVSEEAEAMVEIAPVEGRRRRSVTQELAAPEVKAITDADLAKAASNAAAIVGTEVVQAVMQEFHVQTVSNLAPDMRGKFIEELEIEIKLAKEELAQAGK